MRPPRAAATRKGTRLGLRARQRTSLSRVRSGRALPQVEPSVAPPPRRRPLTRRRTPGCPTAAWRPHVCGGAGIAAGSRPFLCARCFPIASQPCPSTSSKNPKKGALGLASSPPPYARDPGPRAALDSPPYRPVTQRAPSLGVRKSLLPRLSHS